MIVVIFSGCEMFTKVWCKVVKIGAKVVKKQHFWKDSSNELKCPNWHFDPYPTTKTSKRFKESASHHVFTPETPSA